MSRVISSSHFVFIDHPPSEKLADPIDLAIDRL
jgi:hypothetical protein